MRLLGKTTISPVFFYTGKISGYLIWLLLLFKPPCTLERHSIYEQITGYILCALLMTGLILVAVSFVNLGHSTSFGLPDEKTVFKKKGLYKVSRNPMYVGFNLLTIASMIYFGGIIVFHLGTYSIVIYHFIILGEEKFLETRFGKDYTNYKNKVRRYI